MNGKIKGDGCEYGETCELCTFPGDRCKDDRSRKEVIADIQKQKRVEVNVWRSQGKTDEQIAMILGVSLKTVQRRLSPR